MVRRILVAGLGGMAGLLLWIFLLHPAIMSIGERQIKDQSRTKLDMMTLGGGVMGFGFLAAWIGEKLRLIPTQEEVDQQQKPVSLFSDGERRDASLPVTPPETAATESTPGEGGHAERK